MTTRLTVLAATIAVALTGCNSGSDDKAKKDPNDPNNAPATIEQAPNGPNNTPVVNEVITSDDVQVVDGDVVTEKPNDEIVDAILADSSSQLIQNVHKVERDGIVFEYLKVIPVNTKRHVQYVLEMKITNNSDDTLNGILIETNDVETAEQIKNLFGPRDYIRAGESMTLVAFYEPRSTGEQTHVISLDANNLNSSMDLVTSTVVSEVPLTVEVKDKLPKTTKIMDSNIPFHFSIKNNSDVIVDTLQTRIQTKGPIEMMGAVRESENCIMLEAGETCEISGAIRTHDQGYAGIVLHVDYMEGHSFTSEQFTHVTDTGFVTDYEPSLGNITVGKPQPIEFTVQNVSDKPLVLNSEFMINNTVDWTATDDKCTGKEFAPDEKCTIKGNVTALVTGTHRFEYNTDNTGKFTGFTDAYHATYKHVAEPVTISSGGVPMNVFESAEFWPKASDAPEHGVYAFSLFENLQNTDIVKSYVTWQQRTSKQGWTQIDVMLDDQKIEIELALTQKNGQYKHINDKTPTLSADQLHRQGFKTLVARVKNTEWDKLNDGDYTIPLTFTALDGGNNHQVTVEATVHIAKNTKPTVGEILKEYDDDRSKAKADEAEAEINKIYPEIEQPVIKPNVESLLSSMDPIADPNPQIGGIKKK